MLLACASPALHIIAADPPARSKMGVVIHSYGIRQAADRERKAAPLSDPLTFIDHLVNIFHLVIKELRSIRADPVMLVLVVYSFSISVNTVATGAVTEATNLSVGIVDEDGSDLSRQIAEALTRPTFQPPVQITASDIDPMMDQGKLLFVVEIPPNFEADVRARRNA